MSDNVDLQTLFKQAFDLLDKEEADGSNRKQAYEMLKAHFDENKQNYEYLWRLARATYLYMQNFFLTDKDKHKELCFEAKEYAFAALALNDTDPDVHKYCSMTLGTSNDYVGTNEKIKNGHAIKHHIDEALKLRPDDATLHHLAGRWSYNVAGLGWFERKIASALFSAPPVSTYDDAVKEFLEAERLRSDWKENQLYIAMCYEHLNQIDKMKEWLKKAESVPTVSADDEAADKDVKRLLAKY